MAKLEAQIGEKQSSINRLTSENEETKKKVSALNARYLKDVGEQANKGQIVVENKCKKCFLFRNEPHYKNISFDHFSEILHKEIMVYLKWLKSKLDLWHHKAERIIREVEDTILQTYPAATVLSVHQGQRSGVLLHQVFRALVQLQL